VDLSAGMAGTVAAAVGIAGGIVVAAVEVVAVEVSSAAVVVVAAALVVTGFHFYLHLQEQLLVLVPQRLHCCCWVERGWGWPTGLVVLLGLPGRVE
jgi:hypothetical protein